MPRALGGACILLVLLAVAFGACLRADAAVAPSDDDENLIEALDGAEEGLRDEFVVPDGEKGIDWKIFGGAQPPKRIVLSSSVEEIDFDDEGFGELEEWIVDEENPHFQAIDGVLFSKDGTRLISCPRKTSVASCVAPNGVREIAAGAFRSCENLKAFAAPASVATIGDEAFCGCASLKTVVLADGVREIGERAFADCVSLETISIPSSVSSVGYGAFSRCKSLKSIEVGAENRAYKSIDGVLFNKDGSELLAYPLGLRGGECVAPEGTKRISGFIGDYMGDYVETIALPESVEDVCGVQPLKEWRVAEGNPHFQAIDGVLFSKDGTKLICFPSHKPDVEYAVPDGTQEIADGAFFGCDLLESVALPSSVVRIGVDAFSFCGALKTAELSEGLREIGANAFRYCRSLESICIPSGVVNFGVGKSPTLSIYPSGVFAECEALQAVEIGDGIREISFGAFYDCKALESISIPSSVVAIGDSAFEHCQSLTSVEIPPSVSAISQNAFPERTEIRAESGSYAEKWAQERKRASNAVK